MPKPRLRIPLLFASWLAALATFATAPAWGQADDEKGRVSNPQAVIVPPAVKSNEGAQYPAQALSEGFYEAAEVELVLTIDPGGRVTNAVVDKPAGHGFDEAALAAAQKLAFEPATRDGKPVAARTRFVYRFTPPPAVLSGRVVTLASDRPIPGASVVVHDSEGRERTIATGFDGTWRLEGLPPGTYHVTVSAPAMSPHEADETLNPGQEAIATDRLAPLTATPEAATSATDAGAENVEEVEVRGEKPPREVTKRTLEQREIEPDSRNQRRRAAFATEPPGVGRPPALSGLLIVRGAAPQDTQYFVDGTPIPLVYHFGGLSSVVPTEMLDRIDFYPGNFSSQYGRAMGGIVDVGLTSPAKDKLHVFAEAESHRHATGCAGAPLRHGVELRHRRAAILVRYLAGAGARRAWEPA